MADWQPLVTDPERRAKLVAVIREIVDAVPRPEAIHLCLDRAVTRAYLAQDDTVPDPDDDVGQSLAAAVTAFATTPATPALYGGACAVGWTIEHLAGGDTAAQVCDTIDRRLLERLDSWSEDYDLISGLVGFGVYGIERAEAGRAVVARVVDLLVQSARSSHGGLAWHTAPELLPEWMRVESPAGHYNIGLAHGIAGVIGFLARCVRHDAEPRAHGLLEAAMTYLLAAAPPPSEGMRFPTWLPETRKRRRTAWCYGDLGVATCILAAARACERDDWNREALVVARACATGEDDTVRDAGLCHGTAGALHTFVRLWNATREPVFAEAANRWIDQTLAIRRVGEPPAGYPTLQQSADGERWGPGSCILTDAPGVALALHAAISEIEPTWDRMMLLDVS